MLPADNNKSNSDLLMEYGGLATQLLVLFGGTIWLGMKLDKWLHIPFPLLIWLLPLITFIIFILKIVKETSNKRNNK